MSIAGGAGGGGIGGGPYAMIDASRGKFPARTTIHKFGSNPAVGTTEVRITSLGAAHTFLTAATTIRIKAGNAADTADGAGARTITVQGLDATGAEISETLTCNGGSAGAAGSKSFLRINRAWVATSGTYTGANTGDVVIENSAGGTDLAHIAATRGQTLQTVYTVPLGCEFTATGGHMTVASGKTVAIRCYQRRSILTVGAPFTARRIWYESVGVAEPTQMLLAAPLTFPALTDVWATGIVTATTAAVSVVFGGILSTTA